MNVLEKNGLKALKKRLERWTVGDVYVLHDQRPETFTKSGSGSRFKLERTTEIFLSLATLNKIKSLQKIVRLKNLGIIL